MFSRIFLALALCIAPLAHGQSRVHIYLLMGQSNMAGRGALDATPAAANPRIVALAPDGTWQPARDPLHEKIGRTEPGVGPGLSFAEAMLQNSPGITIGLVPCAVGGSPLKRWVKGGDLYEQAVARAKTAMAAGGVLSGVLWHQGETDSDKQPWADTYETRLVGLFADLRSDLGHPELPVIVGEIGRFLSVEKHPAVETVRTAILRIPAIVPHTALVESADLVHKGDYLHFDTPSARELGRRYATAMLRLSAR